MRRPPRPRSRMRPCQWRWRGARWHARGKPGDGGKGGGDFKCSWMGPPGPPLSPREKHFHILAFSCRGLTEAGGFNGGEFTRAKPGFNTQNINTGWGNASIPDDNRLIVQSLEITVKRRPRTALVATQGPGSRVTALGPDCLHALGGVRGARSQSRQTQHPGARRLLGKRNGPPTPHPPTYRIWAGQKT